MINPDSPTTELLPGFTRADLQFLAECLEGRHGEGRVAEAAPRSAAFIRAAMAPAGARLRPFAPGGARLLARPITDNDLEAADRASTFQLTDSERRMIEKQRAHEARNRGDEEQPPVFKTREEAKAWSQANDNKPALYDRSNEEDGNGGLPV